MKSGVAVLVLSLAAAATARAQLAERGVFVANNGNLEGSVSVMTFNLAGNPVFRSKYVTGLRPNTQVYEPGTNAYGISLTPDGAVLCVSHATSSTTTEQLTFLRVNADATLSLIAIRATPDSPLEVRWLSNDVLAATRTRTSGANEVVVYRFDRDTGSLSEIDRESVGTFCSYLAVAPSRQFLYAPDSTGLTLYAFRIEPDGTLTSAGSTPTAPTYCLGPGISPDGAYLYGGGGISNSGNKIVGFRLAPDTGSATPLPDAPYVSAGQSPKQVVVTDDGTFALAAHGTDATVKMFLIDHATGSLQSVGAGFDVGLQGTLGSVETMSDLVLVTDNSTATDGLMGLYSFRILPIGVLEPTGSIQSTQGTAPQKMAVWNPPRCPADFDGNGQVDFFDYLDFASAFSAESERADFDHNGQIDFFDYLDFVEAFGEGC
jgi:hypothetical protein